MLKRIDPDRNESTAPFVTLRPKRQESHESADVIVSSPLRSTSPFEAAGIVCANPQEASEPRTFTAPARPKWQSVPVIVPSPFESTRPPMTDHANLAAIALVLSGVDGAGKIVGSGPSVTPKLPSVTAITFPFAVPSYASNVQSCEPSITPSPALPSFALVHPLQSSPPSMIEASPKNAVESSWESTMPSPFTSASPPMIVGDSRPLSGRSVDAKTSLVLFVAAP